MNKRLKEILIRKIITHIPANIKPVEYLTEILDIGRDSIYRRLNGQIDFSVNEIATLAIELNFSVDEIHSEYDSELSIIGFQNNRFISPEKCIRNMLQFHCNILEELYNGQNGYILTAVNHLLGIFTLEHENLWKFIYYRWIHQFDKVPLNYYYKDLEIPEEIFYLIKAAVHYEQKLKHVMIMDDNIFYNTIREIKYYQESGLIADEEIIFLKEDIKDLIHNLQLILETGSTPSGAKWEIYLSSTNISSNSTYVNSNNKESVYFYINSDSSIYSYDHKLCKIQKEWLESLKRYSILITESNQKMQVDFINRQYKYLEEL